MKVQPSGTRVIKRFHVKLQDLLAVFVFHGWSTYNPPSNSKDLKHVWKPLKTHWFPFPSTPNTLWGLVFRPPKLQTGFGVLRAEWGWLWWQPQPSTGSFRSSENLGDPTWWCLGDPDKSLGGWNFKDFLEFSPRKLGKVNPIWLAHIFQMGWFNHFEFQWSDSFLFFLQKMEGDKFVVMIRKHTKRKNDNKKLQ